ncbi:MAG: nucleoside recognition domain-containing protein [Oscillospiraceae bacterium]
MRSASGRLPARPHSSAGRSGGEAASFVMELPDYRWPDARSVLRRMWVRTKEFLARAFTVILAASVGVWVLRTFTPTWRVAASAGESLLAVVGQALAPLFAPLGFGNWRAATALVTGLLAKETVLSTLGVLLGGDLTAALPDVFSPAAAASLRSRRCTRRAWWQAAMRQELGSRLGTLAAAIGSAAAAWCAAAVVYHIAVL